MENASEALLIAGGILLAILCITLLVNALNNLAILGNTVADKEDSRRLEEWNAEWEAYNKTVLYGADIITVMNKAEEYEGSIYNVNVSAKSGELLITKELIEKKEIFECTAMEDTNGDGRIDKIVFERRSVS